MMRIRTQPFRAGLTFSGRPSGPRWIWAGAFRGRVRTKRNRRSLHSAPPRFPVQVGGAGRFHVAFFERKPHTWKLGVPRGRKSGYAPVEMTNLLHGICLLPSGCTPVHGSTILSSRPDRSGVERSAVSFKKPLPSAALTIPTAALKEALNAARVLVRIEIAFGTRLCPACNCREQIAGRAPHDLRQRQTRGQ